MLYFQDFLGISVIVFKLYLPCVVLFSSKLYFYSLPINILKNFTWSLNYNVEKCVSAIKKMNSNFEVNDSTPLKPTHYLTFPPNP